MRRLARERMIRFVPQHSETSNLAAASPPAAAHAAAPSGAFARRVKAAHPSYLDGLNEEQRRAVDELDGPVLILAGAGVGKTRVLTARIAHLIASGRARGHEILAVTFTNKAAREMRDRVALFSGSEQAMPWLGTFHSIGAKILRMHAELVGLRPNFTILDTDDQLRLLKQLLQAENLDDKRWPPRALANLIDGWKNRGIDPKHTPPSEAAGFAAGRGAALYEGYQARLKTLNAADFGDLLLEPLRLLREHDEILAGLPAALPLYPGRRVPGHERRSVPLAPPPRPSERQFVLRRRRRSVDLRVARRGYRKHPAVRKGFPRRKSDQARAKLSIGRPHPRRRIRIDRAQPRALGKDALHRQTAWGAAEGRGGLGQPRGGQGYRR